MTLSQVIEIVNCQLANLQAQRAAAVVAGDLQFATTASAEIAETEQTLAALRAAQG